MAFRDETEALRAQVQSLEERLREKGESDDQAAQKTVQDLREKVNSQYETIREFNSSVSNLRSELQEAKSEARRVRWEGIFSTWWDWARIAFFFGLGIGVVFFVVYGLLFAEADPAAGFVVSRRHRSAHTTTTCSGQGSSRTCTTSYDPEAWILHVAGDDRVIVREVSEEEWDRTALGSWYCLHPEEGCPSIPPLNDVVEE